MAPAKHPRAAPPAAHASDEDGHDHDHDHAPNQPTNHAHRI
jgi:hypothetical protein